MWWKTTSRRRTSAPPPHTLLDEAFLRRLERIALNASKTLRGGLSGAHPSQRRLPAPTFSDHRAYSTSDDLRYVDWNAYARQEALFVKLGETEQDVNVHLLLDRSRSMDYGTGDSNKLHYGRMLVATLGYLALATGDKLTAAGFDARLAQPFGPVQSRAHGLNLLKYARDVQTGGTSAIDATLHSYTRPRSGGLLVIVSDLWGAGDLDQMLKAVPPPRWQVLVLHTLHTDEIEPALDGELELEDSEHADHLAINANADTLNRYHDRLIHWWNSIETACQRRGASYARIRTDMPIERAVLPYLRQRQVLRG